jgi:hypothetical protein
MTDKTGKIKHFEGSKEDLKMEVDLSYPLFYDTHAHIHTLHTLHTRTHTHTHAHTHAHTRTHTHTQTYSIYALTHSPSL